MTTSPLLLGICGKKGSGKDTLAVGLRAHGFVRIAFADKVKEAVCVFDPLIIGVATGFETKTLGSLRLEGESDVELCDRLKNDHPHMRYYLQRMGNEVGQGIFGKNVWIDLALSQPRTEPTVITDVRYPHEAEAIRAQGGKVLRIFRPDTDDHGDSHASETSVDQVVVDAAVHNTGTVDDLWASGLEVVRAFS